MKKARAGRSTSAVSRGIAQILSVSTPVSTTSILVLVKWRARAPDIFRGAPVFTSMPLIMQGSEGSPVWAVSMKVTVNMEEVFDSCTTI